MIIQIAVNTVVAGYAASMYSGSPLTHAAAGAVGSFVAELIGSVFYFGFNDWKMMSVATLSAPIITGLSIALNDQLALTNTYLAIGVGQFIFALASFYR